MTIELVLAIGSALLSVLTVAYAAGMLGQRVRTNERDISEVKKEAVATRSRVEGLATKEDLKDLDGRLEKRFDQLEARLTTNSTVRP